MTRALLVAMGLISFAARADFSGNKWSLPSCTSTCAPAHQCVAGTCAITYRIAETVGNIGVGIVNGGLDYDTVVVPKLKANFAAWSTGRVGCNTSWSTANVGAFTTPVGFAAVNGSDFTNNVIFLSGTEWKHLPNELALTTTTYRTDTREIVDADMELNNNVVWSVSGNSSAYDLDSVVLHEVGHFLGLTHTQSASAVMYAFLSTGQSKRVLSTADQIEVCTLYPGGTSTGQGSGCSDVTTCVNGLVCEGASAASKICTQDCSSVGASCPSGYTCQTSNAGFACLPRVGAADQCKFCQSGGECSSGLCLRFTNGNTFCSSACSSDAQCGSGSSCQLPDGFCVPTSNACTNQCSSTANCPSSYVCSGGACLPRGDPGDQCTVSGVCKACSVCTLDNAGTAAFCRACCQTSANDALCRNCGATSCGTDAGTCTPLSTGMASVCLPGVNQATICQGCVNGACADGLICVLNRCRVPCNAAAPGSCQACVAFGGETTCACSDELVSAGEACGVTGSTLAACQLGTQCVAIGSSTVCRSLCDVGTPNSCPTGFSCQLQGGVGVCLPGSQGSVCRPCTNTNGCNAGLTCYLGRCYQPCNLSSPTACSSCVETVAGGVCGCPDQVSPENGECGVTPTVLACAPGTRCFNGSCRARCVPTNAGNCPLITQCTDSGNGEFFCLEPSGAGGGGGGGTSAPAGGGRGGGRGGGSATGGSGGGPQDLGCGCTTVETPLWLVVALLAFGRRPRFTRLGASRG